MAEPALARMSIDDFLRWDPGGDRRYELVDGRPVAMAPPAAAHRIVAGRLGRHIGAALDRRPSCTIQPDAGIRIAGKSYTLYEADLAVTCRPHRRGQQEIEDPVLIVEVLSPGPEAFDRKAKLPDYRLIPSVEEIALVDSETAYAEIHRRAPDGRWLTDIVRGRDGQLRLASIDLDLPLSTLYDGVELDEPRQTG